MTERKPDVAQAAPRPPLPQGEEHKKLAEDWYTWGFQAGMDAARAATAPQQAQMTEEMERLRDLLHESRQYVSDAGFGCEDDNEVKIHSEALLALIDQALATPLSRPQQG